MEWLARAQDRVVIDPANYAGRGPALVKHWFLDRYLRDQLYKVANFGTFIYVDLFAGPWQSRTPDYSDTSFGIALSRMQNTKADLKARFGRDVHMIAHLVELERHEELREATSQFLGDIDVRCYAGRAEEHTTTIARAIPARGFRFVNIDPKGLPDIRVFEPLIAAPNTEVLVNFMFQFANRFIATKDRMPKLVEWLGQVAPGPKWQEQIDRLSGKDREAFVTQMARDALAAIGGWKFAPVITVDETDNDRPLYKLIYLSQHEQGLKLFRDAAVAALTVQAQQRTQAMAAKREATTRTRDMFIDPDFVEPAERSAKLLESGRLAGKHFARMIIDEAGSAGVTWKKLWTDVLDSWVITHKELGDQVATWHRKGEIKIPDLRPPARKPKDDHVIYPG
jgi:three-Cys-motif partner protein